MLEFIAFNITLFLACQYPDDLPPHSTASIGRTLPSPPTRVSAQCHSATMRYEATVQIFMPTPRRPCQAARRRQSWRPSAAALISLIDTQHHGVINGEPHRQSAEQLSPRWSSCVLSTDIVLWHRCLSPLFTL